MTPYNQQRKPNRNRRSSSGGYARGDDTRARLIHSGLRLFGQHGFAGASTRDIAADAGANAPALLYYFSSKEGLYLACVQHMVTRMKEHIGTPLADVERLLVEKADDETLIDAYCTVQEHMVDFILSSSEPADWMLIVVREQAGIGGPDVGFQLMYDEVTSKLIRVKAAVMGCMMGVPATADEARVRAMTLNGQLLGFLFLRRTFLKALGWSGFDAARTDLVKRTIRENSEGMLRSMVRARDSRVRQRARKKRAR
jgi:TetR/AcrR family transcriptional regulator, regulator of cefoperazone and chloramphenicol sensitivity